MLGAAAAQSAASSSLLLPSPRGGAFGAKASRDRDFPPASRIFVRNLPYSISESNLKTAFTDFGQILEVKLARDEDTKKSKGYGFVQYSCQDHAILAIEHMDGKFMNGRAVLVELAKPLRNRFPMYPISSGPPQQNPEPRRVCSQPN